MMMMHYIVNWNGMEHGMELNVKSKYKVLFTTYYVTKVMIVLNFCI